MARLIGPDEGSRLVYVTTGTDRGKALASGFPVLVYSDAAATTLADIQTLAGATIPGSALTVDDYSQIPLFKFPDGVDTVYVKVNGGPATAVYARTDDRLDAIAGAVTIAPAPSGGDDTSALQALLTAMPAAGGRLLLRAGTYLVPSGGLTCSRPVTIEGAGAGTYESGGSRIECSSATATVLTLSSPGAAVIGVAFINTAVTTPTAGGALLCTDFDFGRIERCLFRGFYNAVQIDVGFFYTIRDSAFLGPINYGCYMRNNAVGQFDHGDQVLEGCTFSKMGNTADGGTAIRWESGGGLRVVGCKANGATMPGYTDTGLWSRIIHASIVDGTATSVFVVSGCSLEGFTGSAIKLEGQAGAGDASAGFSKAVITGNEFFQYGSQTDGGYSINLDFSDAEAPLKRCAIVGNVFSGYGCRMDTVDQITFVGNEMGFINGSALDLVGVKNLVQGDNFFDTYITDYDQTEAFQTGAAAGFARGRPWQYKKEINTLTTNAYYGKIRPGDFSAGVMTVRVSANVSTVGAVQLVQKRAITKAASAAAAVVSATVGTDLAFGAAAAELTITFDVAAETGYVKPKVTSVNGKTVRAFIEVEYDGPANIVSYAN